MNNFDNFFDNLLPLRPLIPFVQSVLPTVFDDSLSYLETLGKVVKALNDTESNVNTLEDAVRAFADDLSEFENLTIYPVNMTFNENTGNYSADKTFADIDAALLEGRTPVLHVLDRDGRNYYSAQLAKAGNAVFYWTTPLFYEDGESVIFRAFINSSGVSGVISSPIDSGAVVVNYTTVSGSDTPVVDKTFEQISAALEDNKPVFLFVDSAYWIPLSRANRSGNDVDGYHYISAEFIYAIPVSTTGGNNLGVGVYSVNTSDVWSVTMYAFPDTEKVNALIDARIATLDGFNSIKKLIYNESTGNVVYYDGASSTPMTGEEVQINFLSDSKIYVVLEGGVTMSGNTVYNLYVPLRYGFVNGANIGVEFYRVFNGNIEIVTLPANSSVATKTIINVSNDLNELKRNFDNLADATATAELTGSYFDFSSYIGKSLFGPGCLFAGGDTAFDIDISGLDLVGKRITTGLFVSEGVSPIEGYITESQLDANGNQIYPTSGYHYVNHVMEILEGCTKIRLYCSPQGYTNYQNAILNHAQLYTTTAEQVPYTVSYTPVNQDEIDEASVILADISKPAYLGSYFDFSPYIGKKLIGSGCMFPAANTAFDIDVSGLDLSGKRITTYLWLSDSPDFKMGYITETQLDADGNQISPSSGYHYIGSPATILPNCKTIRLFATQNALTYWGNLTVEHAQLFESGSEQVDFEKVYVPKTINAWQGKKWVSYGDSITAMGLWQQHVVNAIGLTLVNAGLGGSSVADGNDQSIASFTDAGRISALPTDADIVTIMGGTNDFNGTNNGEGSPLGNLPTSATFDTATFIGALCQTVKLIQSRCPNALIVICGNIGGRGNTGQLSGYQLKNSLGLTCADYAKAAKSVAEYMGIPYVATDECGINPFNRLAYIADSVHPNAAGAELISRPVIAYFETNQPN